MVNHAGYVNFELYYHQQTCLGAPKNTLWKKVSLSDKATVHFNASSARNLLTFGASDMVTKVNIGCAITPIEAKEQTTKNGWGS